MTEAQGWYLLMTAFYAMSYFGKDRIGVVCFGVAGVCFGAAGLLS